MEAELVDEKNVEYYSGRFPSKMWANAGSHGYVLFSVVVALSGPNEQPVEPHLQATVLLKSRELT